MSDRPIRVMVVDDSVVIRKVVTDVLSSDPDIEVVGTAANGKIALAKMASLAPDLITLDIEMPEVDGLDTLRAIRKSGNRVPIIMFSTLTERGASATMDALLAGANDYVTKPANVGSMQAALAAVSADLLPRVRALCGRTGGAAANASPKAVAPVATRPTQTSARLRPISSRVDLVVIGVSTGGPNALAEVLPALPASLPVPILVVQHMPPLFTRYLADRLDRQCELSVFEAQGGEIARPGEVWVAPGGSHLAVERSARGPLLRLTMDPPENSCRPAADVLFRTAAAAYGSHVMAVVMTGMGYDGRKGARDVRAAGGQVMAQDEKTSVVWGMPGAVVADGTADHVRPLHELADEIVRATMPQHALAGSSRRVTR